MKTIKNKLALALIAAGLSFSVMAADLKLGYASDPVSLDPHEQLSGGTLQLSHMVFDPLVRFTQKMDFEPRLAQSWERIDANTFRFTLRQGVKFHSGNPLTADDVIWTFNRLQASPDFKAIFEPYSEMKKIDDYRYKIIEPFLKKEKKLKEIESETNVSYATLKRWVTQYKTSGLSGLKKKNRVDKDTSKKINNLF